MRGLSHLADAALLLGVSGSSSPSRGPDSQLLTESAKDVRPSATVCPTEFAISLHSFKGSSSPCRGCACLGHLTMIELLLECSTDDPSLGGGLEALCCHFSFHCSHLSQWYGGSCVRATPTGVCSHPSAPWLIVRASAAAARQRGPGRIEAFRRHQHKHGHRQVVPYQQIL